MFPSFVYIFVSERTLLSYETVNTFDSASNDVIAPNRPITKFADAHILSLLLSAAKLISVSVSFIRILSDPDVTLTFNPSFDIDAESPLLLYCAFNISDI